MPIDNAPDSGQENEPFVVDHKLAQSIAKYVIEPYKQINNVFAGEPEKQQALLKELDAEVQESVEKILAVTHIANVTKAAIKDLGQYFSDSLQQMSQEKYTVENFEEQFQRVRDEVDAKLAVQSKRNEEEKELPPYFDEWCRATTAEVVRIIRQTINGVN